MKNDLFSMTEDKDAFHIREESADEATRFVLKGRVSAQNATEIEFKLIDAMEIGKTYIVLDMSRVEYLCSTGIRVILKSYKKALGMGGSLKIDKPSESVRNVLGLTALDELLFV